MKLGLKKFYKSYLIALSIFCAIGLGIFLVFFFTLSPLDGATMSAIILLGAGGLMFVANEGFFDIFSYGFRQMFCSMFGKKANACNDFPGYKEQKRISREERPKLYLSALVVGVIFLIVMLVLRISALTM